MSSITIKNGKGYEESWFVCSDDKAPIRGQLIEHFGLNPEDCEGLTTHDIAVNCTKMAQSISYVAKTLGGTIVSSRATTPDEAQQPSGPTAAEVFAAAKRGEALPDEPTVDPVLARIEAATAGADLKALYAEMQVAGTPIVGDALAAWKARGKALKGAS